MTSQSTTASSGSSSRTRQAPSSSAKPTRVKKRKVTTASTTPRQQVHIPLPDPSGPVPPHFLRSQTGLLGLAGLVGGVNPAQLKLRGQTPTNPIVVEEEECGLKAPPVLKAPPKKKSRLVAGLSKEMQVLLKGAKPSEIPVPTKQEILAVLVKEKDLTPIIQGLIKLGLDAQGRVAPSALPAPTSTKDESSTTDGQPPAKKRKVSIVPAGANDWDVPYPFPEGHGPTSYRSSWKTERGKQLIDQLVQLTKVASKKAAVQKFLKVKAIQSLPQGGAQSSSGEVEIVNGYYKSTSHPRPPVEPAPAEERVNKYYKPITATYGLGVQRPPFPVASSSRQSTPAAPSSTSEPPPKASGASKKQRSAPVIAEASPDPAAPISTSANVSVPSSKEASPAAAEPASQEVQDFVSSLLGVTNEQRVGKPSTEPSQDPNELFLGFNNDLFLQDDFFANWQPTFSTPSDSSAFASSSTTSITSTPDLDLSSFSDFAFLSSHFGEPSMGTDPLPTEPPADTSNIDPELLAMSSTMRSNPLDDVFPLPEEFGVASPNSSISPFTGGPATPASADWDMTLPDVFAPQASTNMQDPLALLDFGSMNADPGMDLQQQQSEQGDGLGEWAALASLNKFGKADGVDMGAFDTGGSMPASGHDVGQPGDLDLGSVSNGLVEEPEAQHYNEPQTSTAVAEQMEESQSLLQRDPSSPATVCQESPNPDPLAAPTSIPQLPPQPCDPQPSLQPSSTEVAVPAPIRPTPSSKASAPTKSKLASQKEETIKRIKNRKAELEAELQKVKLQLWETTIEQGALGHVVQYYQRREKENEHQHQRPQEHIDPHSGTPVPAQVLSTIDNTPPLS